jgi:hypothetical protein
MRRGFNASKWLWALTLMGSAFLPEGRARDDKLTYHYNFQRTGWDDHEVVLTPKAVQGTSFGLLCKRRHLTISKMSPRAFLLLLFMSSELKFRSVPIEAVPSPRSL